MIHRYNINILVIVVHMDYRSWVYTATEMLNATAYYGTWHLVPEHRVVVPISSSLGIGIVPDISGKIELVHRGQISQILIEKEGKRFLEY